MLVSPGMRVWFGALLCISVVRGSRANRRCEKFTVMSSWHAGLAFCCVQASFGVAVPIGAAKNLR